MGDILKFEPKRSGKVLRKHDASASAVIIIFSGIRYERLTGANTKTRAGGKSKRSLVVTNPPATHVRYNPVTGDSMANEDNA